MFKKLILVAVVGGLAVAAFKGTKWASYARQEIKALREAAEDQIPPEKEVARLRGELKMLDTDIMKVVNQLAKERVECERIKEQVADLRVKQSNSKELLNARRRGHQGSRDGRRDLRIVRRPQGRPERREGRAGRRGVALHQQPEVARLARRDPGAREQVKDQLEKQLEELKNQKLVLANEVDALEAELNRLKLEQMKSKYQTDNTRLSKIKEDMRALKMKVDVEREKLKLMPVAFDNPASASPNAGKSVDDIMAPVNGNKSAPAKPTAPQVPQSND